MRPLALALLPIALCGFGCGKAVPPPYRAQPVEKPFPRYTAGKALVLEYHDVAKKHDRWSRTPDVFRKDLDRLYRAGYRPVTLAHYVSGRFRLPKGKSPVVLTFDDARGSQFRYLPNGKMDSDCAVAILEDFHAKHPDFAATATFFVLPYRLFDQRKLRPVKLKWLVAHGYEIGCHTVSHRALGHISDEGVQKEISWGIRLVQGIEPKAEITSLALPSGSMPKHAALVKHGSYGGHTYDLKAAVLAGAGPAWAPASPHFRPYHIPRVQAIEGPYGITYWLNWFDKHPKERLVAP